MAQSHLLTNKSEVIVGVGSALVDLLLRETDTFLIENNAQKGGMKLVSSQDIDDILSHTNETYSSVPGGSACNTIIGIGNLGLEARFIGKRGDDRIGKKLEDTLCDSNVEPLLTISTTPTGRVLSIITPDAQRSMVTFLGAAAELNPDEMTHEKFHNAAIVHIEGYLLFNEKLLISALELAKKAGALISLDLASYTVVESSLSLLTDIVKEYVNIILANEDEARAYTNTNNEKEALNILSRHTDIAALKLGKRGSIISYNNETFPINIEGSGKAVDTTGAGDLWASGFLFGIAKGLPMPVCGTLGAACGYEVCQVIGAHIPEKGWNRIKALL